MSSGSNTPRKPNVAASTLFKASSRFLHGQGAAAGSTKSMKRQRPGGVERDVLSAESNCNVVVPALVDEQSAGAKSKKRFVGVRQRPSGRWVAEIKDTTQKIRLWLGTFDSAEEGAKAYDSAARALRGANTRTNFVPAMACEGTNVPASKAARLIRLRQMAAASKVCEEEAAHNAAADDSQQGADHQSILKVEPQVNDSPALVRQDLQQSSSSLDPLPSPASAPDHNPHLPAPAPAPAAAAAAPAPAAGASSPPKPPRLIGRRHNVPVPQLASPKPEREDGHDHGTGDNGSPCIKREAGDPPFRPPMLEPQQSTTSENLANATTHSACFMAGSPQDSSSPPLSFPSPRSPFECVQPSGGGGQSVSSFVEPSDQERFVSQRPPLIEASFSGFTVGNNFVAPPPLPFHHHAMDASRQTSLMTFRPGDQSINISGLVAFSHHQLSACATNRDHVSMYDPSDRDEAVMCRERTRVDGPMSLEGEKCATEKSCEARARKLEEMEYANSEVYRKSSIDRAFILREKEFAEPDIPWPDYVLMDETGMDAGLLGLDLSCEHSGVYTSAFDFSIDRDSCTSVEHDTEFLALRMQYEQSSSSPGQSTFPQECVLLTEPDEYMSMSPPGPTLSPQETHSLSISTSSLLWRTDHDASACCDGHSSGSTETSSDQLSARPSAGGDGGECTSQDHDALIWSSMDLAPLCMVA